VSEKSVARVFGVEGLGLKLSMPEGDRWLSPLGTEALPDLAVELGLQDKQRVDFDLFDQPVGLEIEGGIRFEVTAPSATQGAVGRFERASLFQDGATEVAPPNYRWLEFAVLGRLSTGISSSYSKSSPWSLSAKLVALGEIEYRHVLAVPLAERLWTMTDRVIRTARLPQRFLGDIGTSPGPGTAILAPGEFHTFSGRLAFDLGAEILAGWSGEFSRAATLFEGCSLRLKASAEAAVKAAFGLGLYEEMQLTVGRSTTGPGDRVRVRAARANRRDLSLGGFVTLQVRHNAGAVLLSVLDHVFALKPVERVMGALREAAALAEADWPRLREKLTESAAEALFDLLEGEQVIDWDSTTIRGFLADVKKGLDAWDSLDGTLQSWWAKSLAQFGLEDNDAARATLGRIAKLETDDPGLVATLVRDLGVPGGEGVLTWIEVLAGCSVEELLVKPTAESRALLERVVAAAARAARFLDEVPARLREKLIGYAQRTGLPGVVEWLRANASSKEALQSQMKHQVRSLVSRLLDKAWEAIDESDVARLRAWATRIETELKKVEEWRARARRDLERIDAESGFSIALTLESETRATALLDFEMPVAHSESTAAAARGFAAGDLRGLVSVVLDEESDEDEDGAPARGFVMRECLFTSQRFRRTGFRFALRLLGMELLYARERRRLVSESVLVDRAAEDGRRRRAEYRGCFTALADRTREGATATLGATIEVADANLDLAAPFQGATRTTLSLAAELEDDKVQPGEIKDLDLLLADLGLRGGGAPSTTVPPGASSLRFALRVELGDEGLRDLLKQDGEASWNLDFFAAARRWAETADGATQEQIQGVPRSEVLRAMLDDPQIRSTMTDAGELQVKALLVNKAWKVSIPKQGGGTKVVTVKPEQTTRLAFTLAELSTRRGLGYRRALRLARAVEEVGTLKLPSKFAEATSRFAAFGAVVTPRLEDSPMLGFWIVLARLSRIGSGALGAARAAATLRWQGIGAPAWSEPRVWSGVGVTLERGGRPLFG